MEVSPKALETPAKIPASATGTLTHQISNDEAGVEVQKSDKSRVSAAEPENLTNLQKKLRRAERFGTPVLLSEEEKRRTRAERFGTEPTLQGKSEEQKRRDRAERFGIVGQSTTDEEEKKKARLARFAPYSKLGSMEEEKRKARALRFSQNASNSLLQTNSKASSDQVKS